MAVVGDVLTSPEVGWQRKDIDITWVGIIGTWTITSDVLWYNSTKFYAYNTGTSKAYIRFKGTDFRLIGMDHLQGSTDIEILVDGVPYSFSQYSTSYTYQVLHFELTGLEDTIHEIEIHMNIFSTRYLTLDAIDINDGGEFLLAYGCVPSDSATPSDPNWIRQDQVAVGGAFQFEGPWTFTEQHSAQIGGSLSFKFYGTQFRYFEYIGTSRSNNIEVWIDGSYIESFSAYQPVNGQVNCLLYQKEGLVEGIHKVTFINKYTGSGTIMAYHSGGIDIPDTGYFIAEPMMRLYKPQSGWQIIDSGNVLINSYGNWNKGSFGTGELNYYLNTYINYSGTPSGDIRFTFYGSKLRLIDVVQPTTAGSQDVVVNIDGTDYHYTQRGHLTTYQYHTLLFEKLDLGMGYHTVHIKSKNDPAYVGLDAIHIDDTGYLVAPVGNQLLSPIAGMTRIDSNDSNILYDNGTWVEHIDASNYNGSQMQCNTLGCRVSFKFNGTFFRIIEAYHSPSRSNDIRVYVDGIYKGTYDTTLKALEYQNIVYECGGLPSGDHIVTIINGVASKNLVIDAIDIDNTTLLDVSSDRKILDNNIMSADAGWQRIETDNVNIIKTGSWVNDPNVVYSGGSTYYVAGWGSASFTFTGTKLRLWVTFNPICSNDVYVYVDGVKYKMPTKYNILSPALAFELTGLTNQVHNVMVTNIHASDTLSFDAIEIDDTGSLGTTKLHVALTTPDTGWIRADERICITEGTVTQGSNALYYNSTYSQATELGKLVFGFKGTDLRLLGTFYEGGAYDLIVKIDGVKYYTYQYRTVDIDRQHVFFDLRGLTDTKHTVEVYMPYTASNSGHILTLDAMDINNTGYFTHPYFEEVFTLTNIQKGQCIKVEYTASSGVFGTFANFGTATKDFIPLNGSATPDGSFYFVCVATSKRGALLIADRVIQHSITMSQLITSDLQDGVDLGGGKLCRLPTCGQSIANIDGTPTSTTTADNGRCYPICNDWDTFISGLNVANDIDFFAGANALWNWSGIWTYAKNYSRENATYVAIRGNLNADEISYVNQVTSNGSYGFRPFLEVFTNGTIWG